VYGQTTNGTINQVGQFNSYQFDASAGDVVRVVMSDGNESADNCTPMTRLVHMPAAPVALATTADNISATLQTTVTNGGRYLLLASDAWNDEVGSYALTLQRLSLHDALPILVYGQTTNGTISQVGQFNSYQFDASAGDVVRVVMSD